MIKSLIKSFITLIHLNTIFFLSKKKYKIIFFYHPKKNLTLIHTYYFENLFKKFPENYKIFYGHNCDQKIGKNYFYIKERLLKFLLNVDYFLCNNICDNFTYKSVKVYFHHNIYDDPWVSSEKEQAMCKRLINYNYIFVANKDSQIKVLEMFDKYELTKIPNIYETGYVKLDYILENFKKNINNKKKSILIAPTGIDGFPELTMKNKIKIIIERLIKETDKDIILRPHPRDRKHPIFNEIKKVFFNNQRFIFDETENYIETYIKSEIMITDMSGTAYTFAYINLCPVIFFSLSENYLKLNKYDNYKFYLNREKIGSVIFNEKDLLNSINFLMENKLKYQNKIMSLRNEMRYFGKSTKRLIDIFNKI